MRLHRPEFRGTAVLDVVGLLVRLGLAAVWFASGIAKASDPRATLVAVRAYQVFGESVAGLLAATLPYLEIAIGVLLVLGLATRLAAVVSVVLLIGFIAGVISAAARGASHMAMPAPTMPPIASPVRKRKSRPCSSRPFMSVSPGRPRGGRQGRTRAAPSVIQLR